MQVPLPWERLLWRSRSLWPPFEQYTLTDFRVTSTGGAHPAELAIDDIGDVHQALSPGDRLAGTSSVVVHDRTGHSTITLRHIRRGAQVAWLLDLLAGDPNVVIDSDDVRAALDWNPTRATSWMNRPRVVALVAIAILAAAVLGPRGRASEVDDPPDDAIYAGGQKRDHDEIVRFMEDAVMPWARTALGPIKGSPDHVTCATCHGPDAEAVNWRMPAVAALPAPEVKARGWETYSAGMDSQMRNAIYGYNAQLDKQARAGYMREVVMPGMARLLGRPTYDFARTYEYNRTRMALGCYHCHKVN